MKKLIILSVFIFVLLGSFGCAGAKAYVFAENNRYPISTSPYILSDDGERLGIDDYQIVDRFEMKFTKVGILYSLITINPDKDIAPHTDPLIRDADGNAIVNLKVELRNSPINYFTSLLSFAGIIVGIYGFAIEEPGIGIASSASSLIMPGLIHVKITGDIVKY